MKQNLVLLGSTGSIGIQTLEVIKKYKDFFEITTLTSNSNWEKLARQAIEFQPDSVVIADKNFYPQLSEALAGEPIKIYAGPEALCQVVKNSSVHTVVNALVGYAGLEPTLSSLESGKKLALANKESLVVAGEHVMKLSREKNAPVLPIDSEHSAILQCLVGERSQLEKIILTASGGPFLNVETTELENVTVSQALDHPNWEMGNKITIDSATMMNKGFEMIEAKWLFGIEPSKIEIIVHPQSIIHSFVEFADGALKAQLGIPDMKLPIQYALTFPERWELEGGKFSFSQYSDFTFLQPDTVKFPAIKLAYQAAEKGGNCCCILNASNEIAVAAFLEGRIKFTDIPRIIESSLEKAEFIASPSMEDYRECDKEVRKFAEGFIH